MPSATSSSTSRSRGVRCSIIDSPSEPDERRDSSRSSRCNSITMAVPASSVNLFGLTRRFVVEHRRLRLQSSLHPSTVSRIARSCSAAIATRSRTGDGSDTGSLSAVTASSCRALRTLADDGADFNAVTATDYSQTYRLTRSFAA